MKKVGNVFKREMNEYLSTKKLKNKKAWIKDEIKRLKSSLDKVKAELTKRKNNGKVRY